jgi:hypothetical protein
VGAAAVNRLATVAAIDVGPMVRCAHGRDRLEFDSIIRSWRRRRSTLARVCRSITTLGQHDAHWPAGAMGWCLAMGALHRGHCFRTSPMLRAVGQLDQFDELIPFLIARSGRPLDAFVGWVKHRRPIEWLLRALEYLPMSTAAHEDLKSYVFPKPDDPDVRARQRMIAEWAVESSPEMREKLRAPLRRCSRLAPYVPGARARRALDPSMPVA